MAGETKDRTEGCQNEIPALDVWRDMRLGNTEPDVRGRPHAWSRSSRAVGATTSRRVTLGSDKIKRLTSGSGCTLSTMTDSYDVYVEIKNSNATAAKVELGVAQAAGQSVPNVLIAAYSTMPGTDAASLTPA